MRIAGCVRTALAAVAQADAHVAIVDLMLPDGDGLRSPATLKSRDPALEVIVITALRLGAQGHGGDQGRRRLPLRREAVRARRDARARARTRSSTASCVVENTELRRRLVEQTADSEILGLARPASSGCWRRIASVADTDANVLIVGESGTGKELVANALHAKAARARRAAGQDQLRGAAQGPHRVRAVRPHQGLVHRRHHRQGRACWRRRTRARCCSTRSPRCRSTCRPSSCACSRSAWCAGWAAPSRARSTSGCISSTNREPERRCGRALRQDLYFRINTVTDRGAAAARADARTFPSSCAPSSTAIAPSTARRSRASSPRPTAACWPTRGRATSASSSTRSSARCWSRAGGRSRSRDLPESLQHGGARRRRRTLAPPRCRGLARGDRARVDPAGRSRRHALEQAGGRRAPRASPPDALLEDAQARIPQRPDACGCSVVDGVTLIIAASDAPR